MKEANRAWSMISHFQVDYFGHIHLISAAPLWRRSVTAITGNDDSAVVSELSGVDIDLCHGPIRVPKIQLNRGVCVVKGGMHGKVGGGECMAKGACVMKGECILVWLEFCECGGMCDEGGMHSCLVRILWVWWQIVLGRVEKRDDESPKWSSSLLDSFKSLITSNRSSFCFSALIKLIKIKETCWEIYTESTT